MDSNLITLNSTKAMAFVSFADSPPYIIRQGRGTLQSSFGNYGVSALPVIRLKVSNRKRVTSVRATADAATTTPGSMKPAILLTENALKHLNKMKVERKEDLCLRIGVRQGGCSGMSYIMDFDQRANLRPDDAIIDYDGFTIVCDPKSLLFLYGMQLDFSDALIGGGFSFKNPNATSTCGCGKSFAA